MKVLYKKASDSDFKEVKDFFSWNDMLEWMKKEYNNWIIEFGSQKYYIKDPKIKVTIRKYDYYVE